MKMPATSFSHKIICFAILALFLPCCAHDPVKEDLVVYMNDDILRIADLETASLARYKAVTGKNFKDDQTLINALNDYIIPQYKRFLQNLRKIRPVTPETRALHQVYLQGTEELYAGVRMLRTALEKQDPGLFRLANAKITKGSLTIERFTVGLDVACEAHGVGLGRKSDPEQSLWRRLGFF